jgi:hypothetical protein
MNTKIYDANDQGKHNNKKKVEKKKKNDVEPTFWRSLNPLLVEKCKRSILIKNIET